MFSKHFVYKVLDNIIWTFFCEESVCAYHELGNGGSDLCYLIIGAWIGLRPANYRGFLEFISHRLWYFVS